MNNSTKHLAIRQSIRNTALFCIGLLVILLGYVTYLQVIESDNLTYNQLNRRTADISRRIERGAIVDSKGNVLAQSKLSSESEYRRQYPFAEVFAHVIGYDSFKYGKAGIESVYDGYLSGQSNPERRLGAIGQLFKGEPGNNLMLTIDASVQQAAYRALGANRGAIVVISPKTGAILAMVSRPAFNPENIDTDWSNISQEESSPLLNRAIQGLYPPGSVIKTLVAEAALAEQAVNTKQQFNCTGKLKIGPDYVLPEANNTAHGKVNLDQALAVSCNVTFGQLALELGRSKMAKSFERYGLNKALDGDVQEGESKLPDFGSLSEGDLAQTGIGQGSLLVTPIKMAMLASAFANKGTIMKPYLVQTISAPDGTVIRKTTPTKWLTAADAKLAEQVANMMITVVRDGSGSSAAIRGVQVAGKTGTAENPHGAPHAWFIGFAPADDPQVAIAVIMENSGSGGRVAAPVARQVLLKALR